MYKKRMTDAEHLFGQFYAANHYNGAVDIKNVKSAMLKKGLWFEFSIKPTPLSREYRVVIIYLIGMQPYVYVVDPNIAVIADNKRLPHVYSQENQQLCLTYPSYNEWKRGMLIADTYIPWIAMWLYFYEEWLLSNDWKGGGRHPGDEKEYESDTVNITLVKPSKPKKKRKSDIDFGKAQNKADKIYLNRKKVFLSKEEGEVA